ncbi:hypothetical protein SAMN05216349_13923 [Oribacterium sp. KHPX15]|uniref:hypothetical protein n=1 Tax=Oribacterium sp. KHPX15 TaxID=1855342 RepID=UPI00089B63A2|nr:hypothetical protein [Oribacterium sp. KHPX15]SEA86214.1 hypothetical protein SAMN05216349_13923 [Oribacterium sp. KHPX15]
MTTQTIINTKYEYDGKVFYELDGKLYLFDCMGIHYLSPASPQANGIFYSNEEYIKEDPEGLIEKIYAASNKRKHNQLKTKENDMNESLVREFEGFIDCLASDKTIAESDSKKAKVHSNQTFPRKEVMEDFEILDKDVFKPVETNSVENKPLNRFVEFVNNTRNNLQLQLK